MKKILKWIVLFFFAFSIFSISTIVDANGGPGVDPNAQLNDDVKNEADRIKEITKKIQDAEVELAKAITTSKQIFQEAQNKAQEFKDNPTKENAQLLLETSRKVVTETAKVNSAARSLEGLDKTLDGIAHTSQTEEALKSIQKTIEDTNTVSQKASELMTKSAEAVNNPTNENADKVIDSLNETKNSKEKADNSVSDSILKSNVAGVKAAADAGGGGAPNAGDGGAHAGGGGYTPGDIKSNWCDDPILKDVCFNNPHNGDPATLNELIKAILLIVTYVAVPLIVLGFAYSAMLFFLAQGKPEELKKAKTILIYSIIGATIIMSAQAIFAIVESTGKAILKID